MLNRSTVGTGGPAAQGLDDALFACLMARFGAFEPRARIAIAVSGGPDSMALLALACRWARARAGSVVAITVDHGLRGGSADEAAEALKQARQLGAECRLVRWDHEGAVAAVQARARDARYRLLDEACRDAGCLHLLVGHTWTDQVETAAGRCLSGSGPDGLAGMPPVRWLDHCRVLRPLLAVCRTATRSACHRLGVAFVDDPSNVDSRFQRVRLRTILTSPPDVGSRGPNAEPGDHPELAVMLGRTAGLMTRLRRIAETAAADLAARACLLRLGGAVSLDQDVLSPAPPVIVARMMAALLASIGGRPYAPTIPPELVSALMVPGAFTTVSRSGCLLRAAGRRVDPWCSEGQPILILRESGRLRHRIEGVTGSTHHWDRRFQVGPLPRDGQIAALGPSAGAQAARHRPDLACLPAAVRSALPGLWSNGGRLVALPALDPRDGLAFGSFSPMLTLSEKQGMAVMPVAFRPAAPLVSCRFGVTGPS